MLVGLGVAAGAMALRAGITAATHLQKHSKSGRSVGSNGGREGGKEGGKEGEGRGERERTAEGERIRFCTCRRESAGSTEMKRARAEIV